jgi:argininosuccinate lyase
MAKRVARSKVWAGRLGSDTDDDVERYTSSVDVDKRLAGEDVEGSRAHARMLREVGIVSAAELRAIDRGLGTIANELKAGTFVFVASDEDIHTAVERRLHELAGAAAGKLHTGRSRNDQVVTDLRLWSRRAGNELLAAIAGLQDALLARAEQHRGTVLPGYTHGQRAQPVSLAHHLLAYFEMLQRDTERVIAAQDRSDVLPLGSGALAGSTLRLDREHVRATLGFAAVTANSMDAVSDRDFAVEVVAALALLMVHLSRLSEELVLWSSAEFGFVTFPDSHATGSSLMPQKKNPDVAELARGRSARVIGDLVTLLTLLKGLPLTYNRDLQEDKPPLFDAVDTSMATLRVLTGLISSVRFNSDAMMAAAADPSLMATDVAEYLVQRGVPFREAHTIVGRAVAQTESGRTLADLTAREWKAMSEHFDRDVLSLFDVRASLRRREGPGGPGPRSVARQLTRAGKLVAETRRHVAARQGP